MRTSRVINRGVGKSEESLQTAMQVWHIWKERIKEKELGGETLRLQHSGKKVSANSSHWKTTPIVLQECACFTVPPTLSLWGRATYRKPGLKVNTAGDPERYEVGMLISYSPHLWGLTRTFSWLPKPPSKPPDNK